jgi:hypothetical protein
MVYHTFFEGDTMQQPLHPSHGVEIEPCASLTNDWISLGGEAESLNSIVIYSWQTSEISTVI